MKLARAVIVLTLLALTSCVTGGYHEGHFEKTFPVTGKVTMYVDDAAGSITVRTGNTQTVDISARVRARGSFIGVSARTKIERIEANPPVQQQGDTIRITQIEDRNIRRNVVIDYDLTVPPQTQLTTRTGAGNQTLSGLQAAVDATTGAGRITAEDLSGDVRLNTGAGNVDVRSIQGGLLANSGAGKVTASGEPKHDWEIKVGAGSIHLEIPAESSYNLDAQTGFGKVNLSHDIAVDGTVSANSVRGKVGRGGPMVRASNGAGSIDISAGAAQN